MSHLKIPLENKYSLKKSHNFVVFLENFQKEQALTDLSHGSSSWIHPEGHDPGERNHRPSGRELHHIVNVGEEVGIRVVGGQLQKHSSGVVIYPTVLHQFFNHIPGLKLKY